jgi:tetratricopeptide (TPR) repeat protein
MKGLCILLVTLLFAKASIAQNNMEELKRTAITTSNDSLRLEAWWLLAKEYRPKDQRIAKKYADSVLKFVEATKNLKHFHKLYKANTLTTLANIEIDNENYDESVKLSLQAIKYYEELENLQLISVSLSNIGAIFVVTNKNEDAIRYLKKSLAIERQMIKEEPDRKEWQISHAETLGNLGGIYSKTDQADSSINYYDLALKIYERYRNDDGIAFSYNGLVTGYRIKKDFKTSIAYADKALSMFRRSGNEKEMTQSYINFSDIHLDLKNYKKALLYADSVEQLCLKNGFLDNLMYTYETKKLAYEQLNDLKNELKYLKKFTNLKDSMNKVNNTVAIEELKTQYETEKKEKAISVLQKDNEIQQLQIEKEATVRIRLIITIISIIVIAALLGWLAIFLSRNIKERKAAYIKLQQKNIEIQLQGELLSEQAKLISKYQSQMNPHFVFNALNSIQGFVINDKKEKTIEQLQLFSSLMRQTLKNSDNEYITLNLEADYLNTYIHFEQSRFTDPLKFEITMPEESDEMLIPPMMVQPFVENAIKHAGLHTMKDARISLKLESLKLEGGEELLKVSIKDNGCGFDVNAKDIFKRSHAISIVKARLEILFSAEKKEFKEEYLQLISKAQQGTEVIFYVPLKYKY